MRPFFFTGGRLNIHGPASVLRAVHGRPLELQFSNSQYPQCTKLVRAGKLNFAVPGLSKRLTASRLVWQMPRGFRVSDRAHSGPRQSRPSGGGQSDGGGRDIACDRNVRGAVPSLAP